MLRHSEYDKQKLIDVALPENKKNYFLNYQLEKNTFPTTQICLLSFIRQKIRTHLTTWWKGHTNEFGGTVLFMNMTGKQK